jgi:hypothetical protein
MKIEHGMNIGTPKKNSNSTEVNLRLIDVHESLLWLLGNIEAGEANLPGSDVRVMMAVAMHKQAIHDFLKMTAGAMVEYNALEEAVSSTVYLNDDDRPQYMEKEQENV